MLCFSVIGSGQIKIIPFTEITFAFPPSNDTHNVMPWVSKPSASFWELGDSRDTHIDSEEFKVLFEVS